MSDPRVADEVLVNLAVVRGNLQQVWRSVDELRASARGAGPADRDPASNSPGKLRPDRRRSSRREHLRGSECGQ